MITNFKIVTTTDTCPLTKRIIVTRCQGYLAKSFLNGHIAITVGDDLTSLSPLIVLDLAFVEETAHVGPEIVVTVVDTFARIEVDINKTNASFNRIGSAVVNDLESLGGSNLGTVRASDGGHLLDTKLIKKE